MTEAEKAYAAAERLIEEARREGAISLDLSGEQFRALEVLPQGVMNWQGLQRIDLRNTRISDVGQLWFVRTLSRINLAGTRVTSLGPLEGLTRLSVLRLDGTPVKDLLPLKFLHGLTVLALDQTQVDSLEPLTDLVSLRLLYLDGIPATDFRPLRGLSRLVTDPDSFGLTFQDTGATRIDPRIAEISQIKDPSERARTLFDYLEDWEPPASPLRNPLPPVVPAQRPAPIVAEFDATGVLVEAPYDSPLAGGAETRARAGWQALRENFDDVAEALSRPNLPNLSRAIAAFGRALGESYETMRPIALGTHGQRIVAISRTSATALIDDAEGELLAFAAAIELHLRRFPDWVEYLRDDAAQSEGPALQEALPQLREISAAFHEIEAIAPALARKFDDLVEAAEDADLPQALARAGVLSSLSNILSAIAGRALAAGRGVFRDLRKAVYDHAVKGVAIASLAAATDLLANKAALLLWLAQQYPSYLGWVPAVLRWLGLG